MDKKTRRDLRRPHPHIRPYDPDTNRHAEVARAGVPVWELVRLSRALGGDVNATAQYFEMSPALVEEALAYAQDHSEEIQEAIRSHRLMPRFLPWT